MKQRNGALRVNKHFMETIYSSKTAESKVVEQSSTGGGSESKPSKPASGRLRMGPDGKFYAPGQMPPAGRGEAKPASTTAHRGEDDGRSLKEEDKRGST